MDLGPICLPILVERDRALLTIYSVMEVNPANGPRINAIGGKAFGDFMVAPETQMVIGTLALRSSVSRCSFRLRGKERMNSEHSG